jgi:hypothetical protein
MLWNCGENRRDGADMKEDERLWVVRDLLFDYLKSPSLRHLRDSHSVSRLAQEIVRRLDRGTSIWRKWDPQRETLLKSALCCWIPVEDMHSFLNQLPGPPLTRTDVVQRLRALEDEEHFSYPKEGLQSGCLALYEAEKAAGTELPAIIQLLRDHVEREEDRLRAEREQHYQEWRQQDRLRREQRLLSGADCTWTQLKKSTHWYCCVNGRTYRLSPTKDKMWQLYRVASSEDDEEGALIGKYQRRGDSTKAIAKIAYQPEPNDWPH